jgi:hypothetical protein
VTNARDVTSPARPPAACNGASNSAGAPGAVGILSREIRNVAILKALRNTNMSLRQIGALHGLSHEMIAVIGRDAGIDVTARGNRLRAACCATKHAEAVARRAELFLRRNRT